MYIKIRKSMLREGCGGSIIYPNTSESIIVPVGERVGEYLGYYSPTEYPVYYDGGVKYITTSPYDIEYYYSTLLSLDDTITIKGKGETKYTVTGRGKKMYRATDGKGNEIRRYYVNKKGELTFAIRKESETTEEIIIENSHGFETFMESVKTNPVYNESDCDKGIYKNYAASVEAKSHLRDILSKHPNWNEEQQCIELPVTIMSRFNQYDVNQAVNGLSKTVTDIPMFSRVTLEQWDWVMSRLARHSYEVADGVVKLQADTARFLKESGSNRDGEINLKDINYERKASRVISAIMDAFKVPRTTEVERTFAVLSDALSIKEKHYKFILSINPTDFVTMSHGNSWKSCHSFRDRGCYHAGSLSYALDKCTMIAYIIPEDSDGDYCKVDKIKRLLYMLDENDKGFMSTKMYPTDDDNAARNTFDSAVSGILNECGIDGEFTKNNAGKYKSVGLHYPDYDYGYRKFFSNNGCATNYIVGSKAYNFKKPQQFMSDSGNCSFVTPSFGASEIVILTPEIEEALASATVLVTQSA